MARYVLRARKFIRDKILHAGDSPHRIALGVAIATFVAFLPIPMSQTVVAVALAALFHANKAVCIPVVWLTNPLTAIPIWAFCLAVGQALLAAPTHLGIIERLSQFRTLGWNILESEFWRRSLDIVVNIGVDLWVGCVIVGASVAVGGYFLSRWAITAHREHRRKRTMNRHEFRAKLRQSKITAGAEPA